MYIYIISAYWWKNEVWILRNISFTLKQLQKPSVTKSHFVGLNHDAELPYKKWIQEMKPFWRNFILQCSSNRIKQSDWLGKIWSHRFFHYGWGGVVLLPISKKITKSTPIRVPTLNFYLFSLKVLQPLLLL